MSTDNHQDQTIDQQQPAPAASTPVEPIFDAPDQTQPDNTAEQKRTAEEIAFEEQERLRRIGALENSTFLNTANMFRAVWGGVDSTTQEFSDGVSIVNKARLSKRTGHLHIETINKSKLCWMELPVPGATDGSTQEFIGLTRSQAKKTPLTDTIADDIMAATKARKGAGATIELTMSSPQNGDILWLAAMRAGLKVKGFVPSAAAMAEWAEYSQPADGIKLSTSPNEVSAEATAEEPAAEAETPAEPEAEAERPAPKAAALGSKHLAGPATSAEEAVELVSTHRPGALKNSSFVSPQRFKYSSIDQLEALLSKERLSYYTPEQLDATIKELDRYPVPVKSVHVSSNIQDRLEELKDLVKSHKDGQENSAAADNTVKRERQPGEPGVQYFNENYKPGGSKNSGPK